MSITRITTIIEVREIRFEEQVVCTTTHHTLKSIFGKLAGVRAAQHVEKRRSDPAKACHDDGNAVHFHVAEGVAQFVYFKVATAVLIDLLADGGKT
jgi:hypothetical protein